MLHLIFFFCSSAITSLKPYDWSGTVLVLCLLFGININRPPLMFMLSWFRQSSIHFQVTLERMPLPTHPSQILTSCLALFLGCHFPGGVPDILASHCFPKHRWCHTQEGQDIFPCLACSMLCSSTLWELKRPFNKIFSRFKLDILAINTPGEDTTSACWPAPHTG